MGVFFSQEFQLVAREVHDQDPSARLRHADRFAQGGLRVVKEVQNWMKITASKPVLRSPSAKGKRSHRRADLAVRAPARSSRSRAIASVSGSRRSRDRARMRRQQFEHPARAGAGVSTSASAAWPRRPTIHSRHPAPDIERRMRSHCGAFALNKARRLSARSRTAGSRRAWSARARRVHHRQWMTRPGRASPRPRARRPGEDPGPFLDRSSSPASHSSSRCLLTLGWLWPRIAVGFAHGQLSPSSDGARRRTHCIARCLQRAAAAG